ncbi:MarR family transcriptional regulator [Streptomyces sp. NPDC001530]|uniref:MarR family transcriptional regulator n=1 Tax=Streptomyces sp. NPDC001530 TaxID=3364582 RepID=UPI0036D0F6E1
MARPAGRLGGGHGAAQIRRGIVRLNRRLRQERSDGGLSPNQLGVLGHPRRHGAATPGEVAAAERQRPQSLTRVFAEAGGGGADRPRARHGRPASVRTHAHPGRPPRAGAGHGRADAWPATALGTLSETERELLRLAGALVNRLADTDVSA